MTFDGVKVEGVSPAVLRDGMRFADFESVKFTVVPDAWNEAHDGLVSAFVSDTSHEFCVETSDGDEHYFAAKVAGMDPTYVVGEDGCEAAWDYRLVCDGPVQTLRRGEWHEAAD